MKILIYTLEFVPFAGGIATFCYELAIGLSRMGHRVTVVAPQTSEVDERAFEFSVQWIAGHRNRLIRIARSVWKLRYTAAKDDPDAILVTQQYAILSVAIFRRWLPDCSVPIIHGSEVLWHARRGGFGRWVVSKIMSRYYRSRKLVLCGSSYARSLVVRSFSISPASACVVYYGMQSRFDPLKHDGRAIRRNLGIGLDACILLTVARLVPRKGQDVMIRALPTVIRRHPNVVYLCVGEGKYRTFLERTARSCGVADRVVFAGRVEESDKYSYYGACDLFVMLSRRDGVTVEGFGLAFLEAWHASKPVLGGRHGGVVEVIDEGVNGLIVDPESEQEVATVLSHALDDRVFLRQMGIRGYQKSARYSQQNMARSVLQAINKVRCI